MSPNAWPLPPDVYWGPLQGPENSWSNRAGESQSSRDGLKRWQSALGIGASGVFDPVTKAAAIVCQQSHGWNVTGNVYPGEWDAVINHGWRLPDGIPLPMSGVLRANIEFCKQGFNARIGDPYDYGKYFDPVNVRQGTDCSGLVDWALNAVVWGPTNMIWHRTVTTESWPPGSPPGTNGPFGTVCIGTQPNWPPGAAVKVSIMHHGGGMNSHIVCEVDGVLMESGGNGNIVEPPARATPIDDSSWTDFWYVPGPIIENTPPAPVIQPPVVAPTAPPDYLKLIYEQLLGPVREDGYGHGWEQLGTNDKGEDLSLVEFLAKYKPALDALLAQAAGSAKTAAPRTVMPPPEKVVAPKAATPATNAPARKKAASATKAASRRTTSRKA